jgi:hypothetical protein
MKRRPAPSLRWAILLILGCAIPAGAQERRATALDPTISTYTSTRAEAAQIPALDRSIGVELEGASLEQALAQIAARTGLRLTYSTDLLPEDHLISLHAPRITAADAVLRVLRGTSLDLLVSASGHAVLVECSPATCGPRVKRPSARAVPGAGVSYAHRRETVALSAYAQQCRPEHRVSSVFS